MGPDGAYTVVASLHETSGIYVFPDGACFEAPRSSAWSAAYRLEFSGRSDHEAGGLARRNELLCVLTLLIHKESIFPIVVTVACAAVLGSNAAWTGNSVTPIGNHPEKEVRVG